MRRRYKLLVGLICFGVLCPPPSLAADNWQWVANYALESKQQNIAFALPWLDSMRISIDPTTIRRADGGGIMSRPNVVRSRYDQSVQHDLSKFYKSDKPRINLLMRYAGRQAGEVISFGFDSGYSAKKIEVKPALFLGYTRAFQVARQTHIVIGVSGWLGGKVSEKACLDSFNRAYYCPTLTAWSDYTPIENRNDIHSSMVFVYAF